VDLGLGTSEARAEKNTDNVSLHTGDTSIDIYHQCDIEFLALYTKLLTNPH
jgi:hypothetical protein